MNGVISSRAVAAAGQRLDFFTWYIANTKASVVVVVVVVMVAMVAVVAVVSKFYSPSSFSISILAPSYNSIFFHCAKLFNTSMMGH